MINTVWAISGIFLAVGIGLIAIGLLSALILKTTDPYRGRANGTVIEIVAGLPDERGAAEGVHDYYFPIVAYYADGILFKEQLQEGSNPCPYKINQTIEIKYDVKSPENFMAAEKPPLSKAAQIFYIIGFICSVLADVIILVFAWRS